MARNREEFCQFETKFILADPRFRQASPTEWKVYCVCWGVAVAERRQTPRALRDLDFIVETTRIPRQEVKIALQNLSKAPLKLIRFRPKPSGDIAVTVYGARAKHRALKWKDGVRSAAREGAREVEVEEEVKEEVEVDETRPAPIPCPYGKIEQEWNLMAGLKLAHMDMRDPALKTDASARWQEPYFRDNWAVAIAKVPDSDYLMGRQEGADWRITPTWFLKPGNVRRIVTGEFPKSQARQEQEAEARRQREEREAREQERAARAAERQASTPEVVKAIYQRLADEGNKFAQRWLVQKGGDA